MTRDLDTDLKDEIVKPRLSPIFLAEFFFDGGTLRFWNGVGDLDWSGEIFNGSGNLLKITELQETSSTQAQGLNFILNGLPTTLLSLALNENYTGRTCNLYFSCLDEAGALVGEPYQIFSGLMDVMQIDDAAETASITLSAENRLIELRKSKVSRYTPEDQKRLYPDDLGLDFVPSIQDKELIWGKTTPSG